MIYRIILFILIPCYSIAQRADQFKYHISIESGQPSADIIYLEYSIGSISYKDSSELIDGKTIFQGTVAEPVLGKLYKKSQSRRAIDIWLSNMQASLLLDNEKWVSKNNTAQASLQTIKILNETDRIKASYYGLYGELTAKKDSVGLKRLGFVFDSLNDVDLQKNKTFIREHPLSEFNLYAFNRVATYGQYPVDSLESLWELLPAWAKLAPTGLLNKQRIDGAKAVAVGTIAPSLTEKTVTGMSFSLSSLKGKIVLIDFWASWCAPCRKEHPVLKQVYQQFQNKSFEIVAVSLDTDQGNWKKAIQDDQLSWIQVSDLNGFASPVAIRFGVKAIPSNVLIDQEGRIVAVNIKAPELVIKLKELSSAVK